MTAIVTGQRACVVETYRNEIGVREAGYNRGSRVEEYQRAAGLRKGDAWCAAFTTFVYKHCGMKTPRYPGYSPNWFTPESIISTRGVHKSQPIAGDLIGIYFQNLGRIAHIGFYDGESSTFVFTVEGNTGSGGGREGDGVYKRKRIKRQITYISRWE